MLVYRRPRVKYYNYYPTIKNKTLYKNMPTAQLTINVPQIKHIHSHPVIPVLATHDAVTLTSEEELSMSHDDNFFFFKLNYRVLAFGIGI